MRFLKGRVRYAIECMIMPTINAYNRMRLKNKDFLLYVELVREGLLRTG